MRLTTEQRVERLEEALSEIGKLGMRLVELFPAEPRVISSVDELLHAFGSTERFAA